MIKLRCEPLLISHFDHKLFTIMSPYHSIVACNENYKIIIVFLIYIIPWKHLRTKIESKVIDQC
jgi:hypothetical protein